MDGGAATRPARAAAGGGAADAGTGSDTNANTVSGTGSNTVSDTDRLRPPVRIAVIAACPAQRSALRAALESRYRVDVFADGDTAIAWLREALPMVILIDDAAPEAAAGGRSAAAPWSALRTVHRLGFYPDLARVPLVGLTGDARSDLALDFRAGYRPLLVKPIRRSALLETVADLVNEQVELAWQNLAEPQRAALMKTVAVFNGVTDMIDAGRPVPYQTFRQSCSPLVEAVRGGAFRAVLEGVRGHDNYTYVHSLRVATFLCYFGHALGLPESDLTVLATGGLLHDVGKMSIPHEVLNKPGRLSSGEWGVMKSHVPRTLDFMDLVNEVPGGVRLIAAQHHEKLDGTGYPAGLKGAELNDLARMAAIVDVFGALTDHRAYKAAMAPEAALDLMHGMRGHLDHVLLALFREMLLDAAGAMDAA
ncbi:HD domain-containing phosphohydrolase [Roseospira goensis]|uniref:HD-GYP domain-containing protein (C-di-GMP phosphodiesterase class II) n=1 Tax=Roseospira goensis TaxID=391922 RepID=A0A7W6RZX8_9PROT|nr:HD domain-containing phosphohydrolase [Roseospira goensis]MBB4286326.1 HD-GYP domain-containing protein (c-di-GMP phosphodiesterase class II) [Roseospira goensis]